MYNIDDLIVSAKSWKEIIEKLRFVFEALRKVNSTLKLRKNSEFSEPSLTCNNFSIFSFDLYFRRFVSNYAICARPISDLTRKGAIYIFYRAQEDIVLQS